MKVAGWGNYPVIESSIRRCSDELDLQESLSSIESVIARGNGRSYGDSALNEDIVSCKKLNYFRSFDPNSGLLHAQAGVLLSEIIEAFLPLGWFLQVTPGTKLITLAGAIASDVHGKNHHVVGCFSECVKQFRMMLADGSITICSRQQNPDLFHATCGGMGLTGVILDVWLHLKPVKSKWIAQTTIKTQNLIETFQAFEEYRDSPYSVAWIDCLADADQIGRCLLNVGDFSDDGDLSYQPKTSLTIPSFFPGFALNSLTTKAFNWLYYSKTKVGVSQQKVSVDSFFYPLDAIGHWNRIYGKSGFVQYQFILPLANSLQGLTEILAQISQSKMGSFLAVLKLYGEENSNWLSFPMKGYSLALDFKIQNGLFALLDKLDKLVIAYGGRIYLAKDARMSRATFDASYPQAEHFRAFRQHNQMMTKFNSLQSMRLGI